MLPSLEDDLAAIARIEAVPTILKTIRESTGLRLTLVARVLPDRWLACAVHDDMDFGLRVGGELDVATTLCSVVRDSHEAVVIDHASLDPFYKDHPTPRMYGFESYISVPIFRRDGSYFGNVCGLDPEPRPLKDGKTLAMMSLFGELIALQLEAEERHAGNAVALEDERRDSKLREQFIAVLGHDVRNPLASIVTGTDLLLRTVEDQGSRRILERVRSSTRRIAALVDDVLDLARGRLGGGIALQHADVIDLAARLRHVIAEVQATNPNRSIRLDVSFTGSVRCDAKRIEQLVSNLLANAIQHGGADSPVTVSIAGDEHTFTVSVANRGEPISERARELLFQPYFRGGQSKMSDGLGLGLFIVSEIAKSHGGRVDVTSAEGGTTFTFTMPREAGR